MTRPTTAEKDWREIDHLRALRPKFVRDHKSVAALDARLQARVHRRLRAENRDKRRGR